MKTFVSALLGLFCITFLAAAADVNGKYAGEMTTQRGPQAQNFTFKTSGDKVEGTLAGGQGDTPISEGKISGDTITFVVVRNFNGNEFKMSYTGKISGDTIEFTVDRGRGEPSKFTAKKQ